MRNSIRHRNPAMASEISRLDAPSSSPKKMMMNINHRESGYSPSRSLLRCRQ